MHSKLTKLVTVALLSFFIYGCDYEIKKKDTAYTETFEFIKYAENQFLSGRIDLAVMLLSQASKMRYGPGIIYELYTREPAVKQSVANYFSSVLNNRSSSELFKKTAGYAGDLAKVGLLELDPYVEKSMKSRLLLIQKTQSEIRYKITKIRPEVESVKLKCRTNKECDRLSELSHIFVYKESDEKILIETESILETYSPTINYTVGMTVYRLPGSGSSDEVISLNIRCKLPEKPLPADELTCLERKKRLYESFKNLSSAF